MIVIAGAKETQDILNMMHHEVATVTGEGREFT